MKLLVADLSNIFYSAWFASADKPIGFAYDVTIERIRRLAPDFDRVVVACDAGHSGRRELHAGYKAHRAEPAPQMLEQLQRTHETLDGDGYYIAKADGFEADDVLGHFARWGHDRGDEITLLTSDKDACCLVTERVKIRSVRTDEVMGPAEVEAKFGVPPRLMPAYLALCGDATDGVPGVKGVGPKHASRLLAAFGSLNGLVEALDATDLEGKPMVKPPAVHAALLAALREGSLELAMRLVSLRTDVPIDCNVVLEEKAQKPRAPHASWDGNGAPEQFEDEPAAPAPPPDVTQTPADPVEPDAAPPTAAMVVSSGWAHALEPKSAREAHVLARHIFESRLFNAYGNVDAVFATVLAGRELGIPALTSLRSIHIIEGKPSLSAHLIVALVLRSGLAHYFRMVESTDRKATYETRRKGDPAPTPLTYTIEDAERAGLTRPSKNGKPSNWTVRPKPMLRKAAAVELARAVYPDVVSNVYDPDELAERE